MSGRPLGALWSEGTMTVEERACYRASVEVNDDCLVVHLQEAGSRVAHLCQKRR